MGACLGVDNIVSIAFETMKSLLERRPYTGRSEARGTFYFLCEQSYEKLRTKLYDQKNTWRKLTITHETCIFFLEILR